MPKKKPASNLSDLLNRPTNRPIPVPPENLVLFLNSGEKQFLHHEHVLHWNTLIRAPVSKIMRRHTILGETVSEAEEYFRNTYNFHFTGIFIEIDGWAFSEELELPFEYSKVDFELTKICRFDLNVILKDNRAGRNGETLTLPEIIKLYSE